MLHGEIENQNSKRIYEGLRREILKMGIVAYAGFAYLLTAVISVLIIGVIVVLNKFLGKKNSREGVE
ncbi:MAG: hypothetical protein H6Q70_2507 [Firmicutes bacterium]|nr:hypothetical protein [Bacillota bacterium]